MEHAPLMTRMVILLSIEKFEMDIPLGKFATSRYSLLKIRPETGRFHQIRKHMAHIIHPIVGDRPHGCNKQNKLWKEKMEIPEMLLHARQLRVIDQSKNLLIISAPLSSPFRQALSFLGTEFNLEVDVTRIMSS